MLHLRIYVVDTVHRLVLVLVHHHARLVERSDRGRRRSRHTVVSFRLFSALLTQHASQVAFLRRKSAGHTELRHKLGIARAEHADDAATLG